MKTKIIEVTNGPQNHGKFLLGRMTDEWDRKSVVDDGYDRPVLDVCGWSRGGMLWVLDLQTGEGAYFRLGGYAKADLDKHRVWVCPMFEPFLVWLYEQGTPLDLDTLPDHVDLPDAEFAFHGYRRPGPDAK